VLELVDAGAHVVASDDLYAGTYRLFERVRKRSAGTRFTFVDMSDVENVRAAIAPKRACFGWSRRANPLLKIADLTALAQLARSTT